MFDSTRRPGTARPSVVASRRLRDAMRGDVADLRVRLEEIALRSEVHRVTGNAAGVEAALAEQRRMLEQFERRIRHRVADAIVEREAETVLVTAAERLGAEAGVFAIDSPAAPIRRGGFLRTVAASAAAALAAMFVVTSGTTGVDPVSASGEQIGTETSILAEPAPSATGRSVRRSHVVVDGDEFWVQERPSLRERLTERMHAAAAPDISNDEQFIEALLQRLFGAVASVTATIRTPIADAPGRTAPSLTEPLAPSEVDAVVEVLTNDDSEADTGEASAPDHVSDDGDTDEPTEQPTDEAEGTDDGSESDRFWGVNESGSSNGTGLPGWN